jgi:protein-disulfide isomerase
MLGRQLGVGSTPTVFIGSLQVEHWDDWESVRAAIMRELGTTATAPDSAAGR